MKFGWRNDERMRLKASGFLICALMLVLLFACQADEPESALPTPAPATAWDPISPVATEGIEASPDTDPADWPRYEATYYSISYPAGWQVEEGFGGQYVVLHPSEAAGAGAIGKIELAYLGYEVAPEDDLFEWFNLYSRVGGIELPERQILENRSAVQPDGTVTRRLHILNTHAQSRSQVILLTHGRLVLSLNGYTHDETMTELLRILADSIVFHPNAPTTKAELYPNEENLVTTLDEVLAIMQAPPPEATLSTTFFSPLTKIGQTAQVTVPDVYGGDYHFQVQFSTDEWRLEQRDLYKQIYPELIHLTIDGCRMGLREGARGLSPSAITVKKTLAGLTWGRTQEPESKYPNYFIYTTHQPDKGISFLIRVETPVDGTDEVEAACQAAAEAVLDTFTLLE